MKLKRSGLRARGACALVAALGSAAVLSGGVLASPAAAGNLTNITPDNTFDLMLDVGGASTEPGAGVITWWANYGANQEWQVEQIGPTEEMFRNVNSNQCLTTDGIAGDQVYQEPCDYQSPAQHWITSLTEGSENETIQSELSGLYLDVYGDSPWPDAIVDTWYGNGGANQYFTSACPGWLCPH
jgi:hypothetical protein